jgi:hypothetical protein
MFFQTHKNTYTGPLGTTDPEYGSHDTKIQSFGQFLSKIGDFMLNLGVQWILCKKFGFLQNPLKLIYGTIRNFRLRI